MRRIPVRVNRLRILTLILAVTVEFVPLAYRQSIPATGSILRYLLCNVGRRVVSFESFVV